MLFFQDVISHIKNEFYSGHEIRFKTMMKTENLFVEFAKTAVSFLRSKICQIYQNNSFLDAVLESYAYETIMSEIYPGMYSSDLLPPNLCCA